MLKTIVKRGMELSFLSLLSLGHVAYAAEFAVVDGIRYELGQTQAKVVVNSAVMPKYSGDIVIPEKFLYNNKKYTVCYVDKAFTGCEDLISVTLPKTIQWVTSGAFTMCSSLKAINVDEGNECLKSVDGVLYSCPCSQNVRESYRLDAVPATREGTFVVPDWVEEIAISAFSFCERIKEIKMPPSVSVIGGNAFSNCTGLESVNIPEGVEVVAEGLFRDCNSIKTITLPQSVKTIGEDAFWQCSSLVSVNLPESVTSIGSSAFGNCLSLASIKIPANVGSLSNMLFINCETLKSVDIPYGVYSINRSAFSGCRNLEKVVIANSVKRVDEDVFTGCEKLSEVYVSWEASMIPYKSGHVFDDTAYLNATLYVPRGLAQYYEMRVPWQNFFNIEEYDYTGVDDVDMGGDAEIVVRDGEINFVNAGQKTCRVYDLSGKLLVESHGGVICNIAAGVYVVTVGEKSVRVMVP